MQATLYLRKEEYILKKRKNILLIENNIIKEENKSGMWNKDFVKVNGSSYLDFYGL